MCLSQCPCEAQSWTDRNSLLGRVASQTGGGSTTALVFSPHVLPGADGSSSAAPSSPSAPLSNLKTILPLFYKNPGFSKTLIFFSGYISHENILICSSCAEKLCYFSSKLKTCLKSFGWPRINVWLITYLEKVSSLFFNCQNLLLKPLYLFFLSTLHT